MENGASFLMNISDLNPDALAGLEAKLVADLAMVRRVRALLEEHRAALGGGVAQPAAGQAPPLAVVSPSPQAAAIFSSEPPRNVKSFDERALEALAQLPQTGFRTDDLRQKLTFKGNGPDDASLKNFLLRMMRQGKVEVERKRTGRGGSIYSHTLPPLVPNESPAVAGEKPPAGAENPTAPNESPTERNDLPPVVDHSLGK